MLLLRCELVLVDDSSYPPIVEAHFHDANGRLVRIRDKEPIFAGDEDPPGQGWVSGTEVRREGGGGDARVLVSLATPYSLETTEGEETVEVWVRDVVANG